METMQQDNWTDFADEIKEIAVEELVPSPFNARNITQDEKLRELADSIRRVGIQQPIIIREVEIEGDVVELEIVAGHRRWEAAKLAGRKTIPAIVRELTDDEARELQINENLHRTDLPPLEEAKAFNEAMTFANGKTLDVQELAARLGKSPVYINRRLTLLDATSEVQVALRLSLIEVGHALELARLSEAEQERLLVWLGVGQNAIDEDEDDDWEEGDDEEDRPESKDGNAEPRPTSRSVLELRRHIANTILCVLGDAPFDPNDHLLTIESGSCADCLKRTGASPLLFSDVRGDDVCTDRNCFNDKVKAHIAQRVATAKSEKKPLLQLTEEYGQNHPKDAVYPHNVDKINDGKPCNFAMDAIYLDGPRRGKIIQVCAEKTCKTHKGRFGSSAKEADPEKAKTERKKLLAKVKVEKEYRLLLFKELLAKQVDPTPTDAMVQELVVFAMGRFDSTKHDILADTLGWPKEYFGWQREQKSALARLSAMSQAEALRVALVGLEANELTVHEYDIDRKNNSGKKPEIGLERVAKLIGVDAAAIKASLEPKDNAKSAKKSATKPAKKAAKKRVLSPESRKRIEAATKKEWEKRAAKK